jgi:hypothetical protein
VRIENGQIVAIETTRAGSVFETQEVALQLEAR